MVERNERKLALLEALDELGEATVRELVNHSEEELTIGNIQTNLNNYRNLGLVKWGSRGRPKTYLLSDKGRQRLEYLRQIKGLLAE